MVFLLKKTPVSIKDELWKEYSKQLYLGKLFKNVFRTITQSWNIHSLFRLI